MTALHFNNGASFGAIRNILNGNADEINNNANLIKQQATKIKENTQQISDNTQQISRNAQQISDNTQQISRNTQQISDNTQQISDNTARISALENNMSASSDYGWVKMSVKPGNDYFIADLYPNWEDTIQGFYITVELDRSESDAAYIHIPRMTGFKRLIFLVCPNDVNKIAFDFMEATAILSPDNQLTIGTVNYMESVTFKDFVARYKAASGIDLETYPQKEEYLPFQYRMDCAVMETNDNETISVTLTPLLTFRPTEPDPLL